MAGYRHKAKTYKLTFEDYPGLEVVTKSASINVLSKMMRLAVEVDGVGTDDLTAEDIDKMDELYAGFAKALVSWNLEDEDGTPVPTTVEGVRDQDPDFILSIVMRWAEAVSSPPDDLGKGSNSGPRFPEGSLPMAPLSPSLGSLMKQS